MSADEGARLVYFLVPRIYVLSIAAITEPNGLQKRHIFQNTSIDILEAARPHVDSFQLFECMEGEFVSREAIGFAESERGDGDSEEGV